ncbi:hypothetical protein HNY73_021014 [Argiope bruennichi]|uniref:Uncharacterized protein n=1 Tax=Argiope bruennichi TaxID=94029 RepID=A0A8T0E9Y3_ARGBR|nr:hypothetical protein HNY73_021014 [Argiope bruennichi]
MASFANEANLLSTTKQTLRRGSPSVSTPQTPAQVPQAIHLLRCLQQVPSRQRNDPDNRIVMEVPRRQIWGLLRGDHLRKGVQVAFKSGASTSMQATSSCIDDGLGIIPILGRGDGPQAAEKSSEERVVRKELMGNFVAAERQNPSYWVRNCKPSRPTEQIWQGQTSSRTDYVLHPAERIISKKVPHKSTLKFAGKMETVSSAMRDYSDPYGDNNKAPASCECVPDNDQSAIDKDFEDIHITITISPNKWKGIMRFYVQFS